MVAFPSPVMARTVLRRAMRAMLEAAGHDVLEAAHGQRASEMLGEREPDVMLLDLYMPEMDGYEVLRALRAKHPRVETIAMTGHVDGDALVIATKLGAQATLEKPIMNDTLLRSVEDVLRPTTPAPPLERNED